MLIPEIFKDEDIIYHYTSIETAIKYILRNEELRLSPRLNSIDPFEKKSFSIGRMSRQMDKDKFEELIKKHENYAENLESQIELKVKNAKQLCFCQNNYNDDNFKIDDFGFLKPRMWDQYGDHYKGVCLAYSKSELLKNKNIEDHQKLNYINFSIFKGNFDTFDLDDIDRSETEIYSRNIHKRIDETFFQKHTDYRDENEYRFLNFSPNKYEYVNTKNSLKGIFFAPNLIERSEVFGQLEVFSKKYEVDLVFIDWEKTGVSVISTNWLGKNQQVTSVKRK